MTPGALINFDLAVQTGVAWIEMSQNFFFVTVVVPK